MPHSHLKVGADYLSGEVTMFCSVCGKETLVGSQFCGGCGAEITPSLQATDLPKPSLPKQVALWNPYAIWLWSLLFGTAFGSFLHAKNWQSLGQNDKAKKQYAWFIAGCLASFFAIVGVYFFVDDQARGYKIGTGVQLMTLMAWYFLSARHQDDFIKKTFSGNYRRRPWLGAISIAATSIILLAFVSELLHPSETEELVSSEVATAPINKMTTEQIANTEKRSGLQGFVLDASGEKICINWDCKRPKFELNPLHDYYVHIDHRTVNLTDGVWFEGAGISMERAEEREGKKIIDKGFQTRLISFHTDGSFSIATISQSRDDKLWEMTTDYSEWDLDGHHYTVFPSGIDVTSPGQTPNPEYSYDFKLELAHEFARQIPETRELNEQIIKSILIPKCMNALVLTRYDGSSERGTFCRPTQEYLKNISGLLSTPSVIAAKQAFLSTKRAESQASAERQHEKQRQACLQQGQSDASTGGEVDCVTAFPDEFAQYQQHAQEYAEQQRAACLEYGRSAVNCDSEFPDEIARYKQTVSGFLAQHQECNEVELYGVITAAGGLSNALESIKTAPPPCIQIEMFRNR